MKAQDPPPGPVTCQLFFLKGGQGYGSSLAVFALILFYAERNLKENTPNSSGSVPPPLLFLAISYLNTVRETLLTAQDPPSHCSFLSISELKARTKTLLKAQETASILFLTVAYQKNNQEKSPDVSGSSLRPQFSSLSCLINNDQQNTSDSSGSSFLSSSLLFLSTIIRKTFLRAQDQDARQSVGPGQ